MKVKILINRLMDTNSKIEIELKGNMDVKQAENLLSELKNHVDTQASQVHFKCQDLELLTTPCLQILQSFMKYKNNCSFYFEQVSENVANDLELLGFSYLINNADGN